MSTRYKIEHMKNSKGDYIFDFVVYSSLIFAFLIVAYPLYFIIIASVSDPNLVNTGQVVLLPRGINFGAYKLIFSESRLWLGYRNTIFYVTGYTIISVSMSLLTAYSLSKKRLFGRKFFNFIFVFTMFFNGGLIPLYLTVRDLGLINKPYTMWIMHSLVVFHVIIARTYFETNIPDELMDAASIDGCNQAKFFTKIVLPLCKPIIAVLVLYCAVGQWNSYFTALIFLNERKFYPLQLVIRDILIVSQSLGSSTSVTIADMESINEREKLAELVKYGVIIVSSAPLLIIYPFLQKYFVKGMMIGAIKG